MPTPTIEEIRQATQKKAPYYFSQDNLTFFGLTLGHFKVVVSPANRIFIYAPWHSASGTLGYAFREFVGDDLIQPLDDRGELFLAHTFQDIQAYLRHH